MLYFQVYKSQLPVIEQALEAAALMLGGDKSRGYCLEMLCADFFGRRKYRRSKPRDLCAFPATCLRALATRSAKSAPERDYECIVSELRPRQPRVRLDTKAYKALCKQVLARDNWRCQNCGASDNLQVHHTQSRSKLGDDSSENLITLCATCHEALHRNRQNSI